MLAPASGTPRIMDDGASLQDSQRRFEASDTADAHGAAAFEALARLGATSQQAFTELARRQSEKDEQDGDVEFQRRSREIMLGRTPDPNVPGDTGRVGFLSMEGNDATANRAKIEQELEDVRQDILNRRTSEASRRSFDEVSRNRMQSALTQADTHVLQQVRVDQDKTREALMQENRNSAVINYMDEREAAANINAGIQIVVQQADADGASEARTEAMIRDYQSSAWAAVIKRRVDDDPSGAQALFEARRGTMNAEDIAATEQSIHAIVLADKARNNVTRLLQENNNDYTAALAAADNIRDTQERDETVTRLLNEGNAREQAEARLTDDAEERARTAISTQGFDSVAGADRALLQREGRWNGILAEYRSAAGGGGSEAQRREVKNFTDQLLLLSDENPQAFNMALDAMRGVRTPGVTDAQLEAQTGLSREDWVARRNAVVAVDAGSFRDVIRRQEEMRGNATIGGSNDTNVTRLASRLMEQGQPLAFARGIDVRRPSLAQTLSGQGNSQSTRNAQWAAFMMEQARRFYQESGGREPTQAEMDTMIGRAIARGNGGFAFEAREKPEGAWWGGQQVRIPFADIDPQTQRALAQAYRYRNPGHPEPMVPFAQVPDEAKQRYAREWRSLYPGVTVAPGSVQESQLEGFIEHEWSIDPARTSANPEMRRWMEDRYARDLESY